MQLLDENGNESQAPVYTAVPLPVTNISSEGGSYHYPEIGTDVEIGFVDGKPDRPIIRNIYPNNKTLPGVKQGEHLMQQRAEVFTKIDAIGNMTRESDQIVTDNARDYCLNSDSSTEKTTTKSVTVSANYSVTTIGNYSLCANTVASVALCDYTIGTNSNFVQFVKNNYTLQVDADQSVSVKNKIDVTANEITEQIKTIKKSIAGVKHEILAPQVWIGSAAVNVSQLMLDTLELIERLADLTAQHTHQNTGAPTNAGDIAGVKIDAINLDEKYSPVIAK